MNTYVFMLQTKPTKIITDDMVIPVLRSQSEYGEFWGYRDLVITAETKEQAQAEFDAIQDVYKKGWEDV